MCGRYVLILDNDFSQHFEVASPGPAFASSYNIAPGHHVPIIASAEHRRMLSIVRWGLRPAWLTGANSARGIINVRSETALAKSTFRAALSRGRVLVPATGFYEWRALDDGTKQPYFFRARVPYVAFAGIQDGDGIAIMTTTANRIVSSIHDRMPVILRPEDTSTWIDPSRTSEEVAPLLVSAPDDLLTATPLTRAVNDARRDDPSLLDPQSPPMDAPGGR